MMRTYCYQYEKDWDEGVHLVLFAARETVQESLGFSPFELVFGHTVSVVSYFSKKLTKCQQNYSTIEKACLALLLALQHFDGYLNVTVHPILVFTDHNPLTFLHKMSNKNKKLTRWSLLLQEYDIVIQHIKGKDNVITDALSRV
jgi:hypothetical protein